MQKDKSEKKLKNEIVRKGYMCGTDFRHELGEVSDIVVYATVEEFKAERTCWPECGIVEVEIKVSRWVEPEETYRSKK